MPNNLHRYTVTTEYRIKKISTRSFFAVDEIEAKVKALDKVYDEQPLSIDRKTIACVKEVP